MATESIQPAPGLEAAELGRLYASMLRIRLFEDAVFRLFLGNEVEGTTHLYQGQEAVAVGVVAALRPGDTVAATYRGHGAALALGTDPTALMAELLGRETGTNAGRGGSMNVTDLANGLIGCFGIVGGSIAAATGAALASQLEKDGSVAIAFFGDGATNQAYFHECLNFAAVRALPIVYVCENNLYGEWTAMASVTAGADIAGRAAAYDMPGEVVDGNDVLAVRESAFAAVERSRAGEGPTLLETRTYRHKGHSKVDPGRYRPREEVREWVGRDPIPRLAAHMDDDDVEQIHDEIEEEVENVLTAAKAASFPAPDSPATAFKEPATSGGGEAPR
jgi:TPP-dependent pyruvate/acetoin dehydrogenase alpha subunit